MFVRRHVLVLVASAMLVAATPTAAGATGSPPSASDRAQAAKACKAERKRLGTHPFHVKYGTGPSHRNAMANCVAKHLS